MEVKQDTNGPKETALYAKCLQLSQDQFEVIEP